MKNSRNFVIIAHIDHGKSTLADRLLEITATVPLREMKPQYLDQLELERERGITIKMAPVRMIYHPEIQNSTSGISNKSQTKISQNSEFRNLNLEFADREYILNLIDTPGHSDFSYEVSRALRAVEGAVLLVDATQGIQAQTLANFEAARQAGLTILGCINKIDLAIGNVDDLADELALLIGCRSDEIYRISAKSGEGVPALLRGITEKIPPPEFRIDDQALIFDSVYDDHKGIIAYVRVFGGEFFAKKTTRLLAAQRDFVIKEVGIFSPKAMPVERLTAGEIGYIATGIKDPGVLRIGDTIGKQALPGYQPPQPVVFVSLYPEDSDRYEDLKNALNRLRLIDSSVSLEPDMSEILGRGFKAGFLGKLHFEIFIERLKREFGIGVITSFPSVAYRVKTKKGEIIVENPKDFPDDYLEVREPIVAVRIIAPTGSLGKIIALQEIFRLTDIKTEIMDRRVIITALLPLAELIFDFDDKLKSVSLGYASFSYKIADARPADVAKMEVLVSGEVVPGLTRIVYKSDIHRLSRRIAEKLKEKLPRQLFSQPIQVRALGRIIARETVPALRKDVTGHLYGGDRSRKMKLWQKQKEGKKKLERLARVNIPPELFKELLQK